MLPGMISQSYYSHHSSSFKSTKNQSTSNNQPLTERDLQFNQKVDQLMQELKLNNLSSKKEDFEVTFE